MFDGNSPSLSPKGYEDISSELELVLSGVVENSYRIEFVLSWLLSVIL